MFVFTGTLENLMPSEIKQKQFSKYKNNPKQIQFPSLEFKSPELRIVDHTFSLPKGGRLAKGELVDLTLQLQNIGQGKATDVVLSFTLNENVLAIKGKEFPISVLRPGESKTCLLQFIANEEYDKTEIDIYYDIYYIYCIFIFCPRTGYVLHFMIFIMFRNWFM